MLQSCQYSLSPDVLQTAVLPSNYKMNKNEKQNVILKKTTGINTFRALASSTAGGERKPQKILLFFTAYFVLMLPN